MADNEDNRESWHLDKRVPLALILTILAQTATLIVWGTQLTERVSQLERTEAVRATIAPQSADRLTRVEVKVDTALDGIQEIKRLIQRSPQQ
jgi:hypothetical protein